MNYALIDVDLGIKRELPLLAEASRKWAMQLALTWGKPIPGVRAVENIAEVGSGEVACYLQDKIDVDGAAAFHDEDERGVQYIRCALGTVPGRELLRDRSNRGNSLLGLIQHEIGEAEIDPTADIWRQQPFHDKRNGRYFNLVCQEVCDPVQEIADSLRLTDGTEVDRIAWALPSWFDARRAQSMPVDSHGALSEPLTLAPGGYAIVAMAQGEKDVFAEVVEHHELGLADWRKALKRRPGSRTMKRLATFGGTL